MLLRNELGILNLLTCMCLADFLFEIRTISSMFLDMTNPSASLLTSRSEDERTGRISMTIF